MSPRKKWSYSLWFISEDYENNAEFVNSETRIRYLREAEKLLKSQSQVGRAAVIVDIAWELVGKVPKALGAEFLHNDQVQPAAMRRYIDKRLKQVGLDEGGLPRGIRSKAGRSQAIDASEAAFTKKPRPAKKKKTASKPRTALTVGKLLDRIKAAKPLAPCNPNFARGMQVAFTPGLRATVSGTDDSSRALQRFKRCDWGEVSREETRRNNSVTLSQSSGQIRGIYHSRAGKEFWVVYMPQDHTAVLMIPEEN